MEYQLADRAQRFWAVMIDSLLFLIPWAAGKLSGGNWIGPSLGLAGFLILAIVQATFLTRHGQTIGKRAYKIYIVKVKTGENGGFVTNVLLRYGINGLLNLIPLYWLVDTLFIFRQDRRCIHDFIAGTQVVKIVNTVEGVERT
ncbi:MAG: RDD family protein [Elusimicrobia bacterium]|nr:RDD family protein [Elusimicrobiota bacterium]